MQICGLSCVREMAGEKCQRNSLSFALALARSSALSRAEISVPTRHERNTENIGVADVPSMEILTVRLVGGRVNARFKPPCTPTEHPR